MAAPILILDRQRSAVRPNLYAKPRFKMNWNRRQPAELNRPQRTAPKLLELRSRYADPNRYHSSGSNSTQNEGLGHPNESQAHICDAFYQFFE